MLLAQLLTICKSLLICNSKSDTRGAGRLFFSELLSRPYNWHPNILIRLHCDNVIGNCEHAIAPSNQRDP
jgi:hypothetical protein